MLRYVSGEQLNALRAAHEIKPNDVLSLNGSRVRPRSRLALTCAGSAT
jgi:hypothetical protein